MEIFRRIGRGFARLKGALAPSPTTGSARAARGGAAIGRIEDTTHKQFPPEEFVADEHEESR
jgi:hypothetical protein